MFKVYNAGKTVAEAVNWSNIKNKVTLLIDGNKKEFKFASGEPIESGQYKITNFLRDENNVVLRSDDGGFVAVLENINNSSDKKTALLQGDVDWEKLPKTGDAAGLENLTLQVTVAGKIIKLGDEYAGIAVQRLRVGTNGKVAVVGLDMTKRVEPFANALKNEKGIEIELFNSMYQSKFTIEGKEYTWQQIIGDLNNDDPIFVYKRDVSTGYVLDEDIEKTLMFKANKQFAEKLTKEGYTVIDLDYGLVSNSKWYNMETQTIFK